MQKKSVALIACTNGYGHIKRLLLLSESLIALGSSPTLFAPKKLTELIASKEKISNFKIVDFNSHTAKENWLNGSAVEWIKLIPDLSEFDIVVSDNLVEVLLIRPDAWLCGSFFWHDAIERFPSSLKKQSVELLKKYNPKMISSELFTSDQLDENTKLFEVGLFCGNIPRVNLNHKTDALIACGMGGSVKKEALKFTKRLANINKVNFKRVWIESDIIPMDRPNWMIPATFTSGMYEKIKVAIIRPGVGTITNSLLAGAKIFPFYENDNFEMNFNTIKIHMAGVASLTQNLNDAWNESHLFVESAEMQKKFEEDVRKIDFNGAHQAALLILNTL